MISESFDSVNPTDLTKKNDPPPPCEIVSGLFCCDIINKWWLSWLGVQNTPTASLQKGKISLTSVLDITSNNLMVRFQ